MTTTGSYAVSHPLVKGGRPIIFDTEAEATQARNILTAHANFAAWLFEGGIPRKEQSK